MSTEIFQGSPEELKARVDVLIAGAATSIQVVPTASKSYYLIIWS